MRKLVPVVLTIAVVVLLWWLDQPSGDDGRATDQPTPSAPGLPAEAVETLRLVDAGGPFPHQRDGVVFENRERLLPAHERGYWREYTVPTPGSDDRGARRLVVGRAGEVYYTDDHYASFRRVRPAADARGGSP